jgi:hypothetical protein
MSKMNKAAIDKELMLNNGCKLWRNIDILKFCHDNLPAEEAVQLETHINHCLDCMLRVITNFSRPQLEIAPAALPVTPSELPITNTSHLKQLSQQLRERSQALSGNFMERVHRLMARQLAGCLPSHQ